MRDFAITYPQLMNQAARYNLSHPDLIRLRDGHDLAQRLVDGLYRKDGEPFLCHLIRTASIVLAEVEGRNLDPVLAALVHAVYFLHYFTGSRRRGPRRSDRAFLRERIGPVAERLVDRYTGFPWGKPDVMRGYISAIDEQSEETRTLILMQLANELEDHLDAAPVFVPPDSGTAHDFSYGDDFVALAEALGRKQLAADLRDALEMCRSARVTPALTQPHHGSYELRDRLWRANVVERVGGALRRRRW